MALCSQTILPWDCLFFHCSAGHGQEVVEGYTWNRTWTICGLSSTIRLHTARVSNPKSCQVFIKKAPPSVLALAAFIRRKCKITVILSYTSGHKIFWKLQCMGKKKDWRVKWISCNKCIKRWWVFQAKASTYGGIIIAVVVILADFLMYWLDSCSGCSSPAAPEEPLNIQGSSTWRRQEWKYIKQHFKPLWS